MIKTLYHHTKAKNVAGILRKGLIGNAIGIVYLTPINTPIFGDTVLEVDVKGLRLTAFEDCKDWEILCWSKVEPSRVRIQPEKPTAEIKPETRFEKVKPPLEAKKLESKG